MPGSKTQYLEKKLLDLLLGGVAFVPPTTYYVALSTAVFAEAATGASLSEVTGDGYLRIAVANNPVNWPAATGAAPATKTNGTVILFPTATASWGVINSFYLCDAATGGNALYGGDLAAAKTVITGSTPSFPAASLVITED